MAPDGSTALYASTVPVGTVNVRLVISANASAPIVGGVLSRKVTLDSGEQYPNADPPILITPAGIVISCNAVL